MTSECYTHFWDAWRCLRLPKGMPEVSRFFGIVIGMFYGDHPPPHFHVRYGDQRAIVAIESLAILRGSLAPRTRGLVTEWAARHRQELVND